MLAFRPADLEDLENSTAMECPTNENLRNTLQGFHDELLRHCNHPPPEPEAEEGQEEQQPTWGEKLLALVASAEEKKADGGEEEPGNIII